MSSKRGLQGMITSLAEKEELNAYMGTLSPGDLFLAPGPQLAVSADCFPPRSRLPTPMMERDLVTLMTEKDLP